MVVSIVSAGEKPHAVCVPFPSQGHVTPMMKLAKVLHSKGFHVTFVNTEYNHRRLVRTRGSGAVAGLQDFRFATIPDGLPRRRRRHAGPDFPSRLNSMPRVTCVVADSAMSFSVDAAEELGVPCALFWAASACGYMAYRTYRSLVDEGLVPLKGTRPFLLSTQLPRSASSRTVWSPIRPSLWKEDLACPRWLDGKAAQSVVYVNYGSVIVMSRQELVEIAWGLANSGHEFLWIVRPDIVLGDWARQPCCPVGLFLTHSCWNSTMESPSAGVPMLCWPFFGDQQTNCRYKCVEWGVGTEVGGHMRRDVQESRIREAMAGDRGREMRPRAAEWKEVAARASQPGGRALTDLDDLINDVLLPRNRC